MSPDPHPPPTLAPCRAQSRDGVDGVLILQRRLVEGSSGHNKILLTIVTRSPIPAYISPVYKLGQA